MIIANDGGSEAFFDARSVNPTSALRRGATAVPHNHGTKVGQTKPRFSIHFKLGNEF